MKLELLAKGLNELIEQHPEFADKDICIEPATNGESKIYVAQYDEISKKWIKLYWYRNLDTIKESIEDKTMKNTDKITMTLGQLKRLVKESKVSELHRMRKSIKESAMGDIISVTVDWATDDMENGRWTNYIDFEELDNIHNIYKVAYEKGVTPDSLWLSDHIDFEDLTKSDLTKILNSFLKKHHFYGVTGEINSLNGPGGGYPEITLTGPRTYITRLLKQYWGMDDDDIEYAVNNS